MKNVEKTTLLLVALIVGVSACGKKDAGPVQKLDQPSTSAAETAPKPETLGEMLGTSYVETLKQVVAILNDRLPAEEAGPLLTDLKEATIELMVNLGRKREAMSVEDRATVDRVLNRRISAVPQELFGEYSKGRTHYQSDRALAKVIADFNIITQYANFDLLKKQAPAEAERLGL